MPVAVPGPRSLILPLCTRNAWLLEPPTMSPVVLTAFASLMLVALNVPRSVIVPLLQLNGSFWVNRQVCLPHGKKKTLFR